MVPSRWNADAPFNSLRCRLFFLSLASKCSRVKDLPAYESEKKERKKAKKRSEKKGDSIIISSLPFPFALMPFRLGSVGSIDLISATGQWQWVGNGHMAALVRYTTYRLRPFFVAQNTV